MSQYRVEYLDPFGGYIKKIDLFYRLEYDRTENDIGSLQLDLPPVYIAGFFKTDGRLSVFVKDNQSSMERLDGFTQYFIRIVTEKTDEQGKRYIHILAHDAISLVDRRIVAYASMSSQAKKTAFAEEIIKAIMRENFGSLATDANRDISDWMTIQPDLGQTTVSITKTFAWQLVLPLIQDICKESRDNNNEYLCFDVVPYEGKLEFRTFIGQRGNNLGLSSSRPVIFSYDNLGLSYASISFNSNTEKNFIYAGGQGQEEDRVMKTAYDSARIALSPFNRIEDFYNASRESGDDGVQSEANTQLAKMSSKIAFNGHIVQRPGLIFGVDYNFGDIVVAKIGDNNFDIHITGFSRVISEGKSEVTIFARNLDDNAY